MRRHYFRHQDEAAEAQRDPAVCAELTQLASPTVGRGLAPAALPRARRSTVPLFLLKVSLQLQTVAEAVSVFCP